MIKWESDCVGCETCVGCGLKRKRPHVYCDYCKEEIDPDEVYESMQYDHLCLDCLAKMHRVDRLDLDR